MSRRELLRNAGSGLLAVCLAGGAAKTRAVFGATPAATGMQYRPLGKTGHKSSLVCFGGASVDKVSQSEADRAVGDALDHGVNHFDVAPTYGEAELRFGPALSGRRKEVFLACKTTKRTRDEAAAELRESLRRLRTDHVDLYQFHALDTLEDLDKVAGPGGAWEAFQEARQEGLVRFIGITGHRPAIQLEALGRMQLDTVMCPVNFIEDFHSHAAAPLLKHAAAHQIGVIAIKAISAGRWPPEMERAYGTWYQPFHDQHQISLAFRYALSQPVTTAACAGDLALLPRLIAAAESFTPLPAEEQEKLLASAADRKSLFGEP